MPRPTFETVVLTCIVISPAHLFDRVIFAEDLENANENYSRNLDKNHGLVVGDKVELSIRKL